MRSVMRIAAVVLTVAAAGVLGGCGDDGSAAGKASVGSAESPLKATVPENSTSESASGKVKPGYQALVDEQTSRPRKRFTPCNLVTGSQAAAIVGRKLQEPIESPQGPTCVYRSQDGRSFVTLAVQASTDFPRIKRAIRGRERVDVLTHSAYCGNYGQPMLYVPLSRGRLLSVAGQCDVARKFAAKALPQLHD
jgi:hypothetical protein